MSYILDALKKSEQERGHGGVPGVQTIHSSSLNYRADKKTYWPYILIVAVLLNLLAIIYFIVDKDKTITASSEKETAETGSLVAEKLKTESTPAVMPQKNEPKLELHPQRPAITEPVTNSPVANTTSSKDNSYPKNKTVKNINTTSDYGFPAQDREIIEFYDLPESIKKQLPAIIISAHVYSSNPLQRSIVINNKFLEQGEHVIDDLILHEITADGAIFDFQGTRFHHGVVSSWQ